MLHLQWSRFACYYIYWFSFFYGLLSVSLHFNPPRIISNVLCFELPISMQFRRVVLYCGSITFVVFLVIVFLNNVQSNWIFVCCTYYRFIKRCVQRIDMLLSFKSETLVFSLTPTFLVLFFIVICNIFRSMVWLVCHNFSLQMSKFNCRIP